MRKLILIVAIAGLMLASVSAWADSVLSGPGAGLITENSFQASKAEAAFFKGAVAKAADDNGMLGNSRGQSVYLNTADQAVSFHWTGEAREARAADGQRRAMINGVGVLTVKAADDDLLLERYTGAMHNGLRHGRGELLAREAYHYNAFYYAGDFVQGRMEGRGVYINNDLLDRGGAPFVYEGEFMDDTFHGHGVMRDTRSGEVIHAGLWLEGSPFEGSQKAWERENKKAELLYAQRRYNDPRIMGQVELANGEVNTLKTAHSAGQ